MSETEGGDRKREKRYLKMNKNKRVLGKVNKRIE